MNILESLFDSERSIRKSIISNIIGDILSSVASSVWVWQAQKGQFLNKYNYLFQNKAHYISNRYSIIKTNLTSFAVELK